MGEQTHPAGRPEESPRVPNRDDLSRLCGELNRLGACYVVVGGFAVMEAGFPRLTLEVDLLVEVSAANEALAFEALRSLSDRAVDQLDPGDVARFTVVRVGDEIIVDLMRSGCVMRSGCGVEYAEAIQDAVHREISGVRIPFASPLTLRKMKQTHREKDIPDRLFLRQLLAAQGIRVEEPPASAKPTGLRAWIHRMFGN